MTGSLIEQRLRAFITEAWVEAANQTWSKNERLLWRYIARELEGLLSNAVASEEMDELANTKLITETDDPRA